MMLWITEVHLNILFIGVKDITLTESFIITALGNIALIFPFIPDSFGYMRSLILVCLCCWAEKRV